MNLPLTMIKKKQQQQNIYRVCDSIRMKSVIRRNGRVVESILIRDYKRCAFLVTHCFACLFKPHLCGKPIFFEKQECRLPILQITAQRLSIKQNVCIAYSIQQNSTFRFLSVDDRIVGKK